MSNKRKNQLPGSFAPGSGRRRQLVLSVSISAVIAMTASAGAWAQEQQDPDVQTLDTMVVTGSHIRGTPEDAALPVEVYTAEDLRRQGSPTVLDFIKSLSVTGSVLGESNQTNTNLGAQSRSGLNDQPARAWAASDLVLMNGRRFQYGQWWIRTDATGGNRRIEILKDGAAATYGSDAIGAW